MAAMDPVRIGILGAARIAPGAMIAPAHEAGHRVVAVAARDIDRAKEFAARHGVERAVGSYAELVADPDVEVVYNPLPNGLHAPWNLRALAAGKHVLTEKPSASNAVEAGRVRELVDQTGLVFMEGFHYLHHPALARVKELLADGAIGDVTRVESQMKVPAPPDHDVRWQAHLAGGSTMDLGCYSLHVIRHLGRSVPQVFGGEPTLVAASGRARAGSPDVDEALTAELVYPNGIAAIAVSDMAAEERSFGLSVTGSRGSLWLANFCSPQNDDRLIVRTGGGEVVEHVGTRPSYAYQLDAFADMLRGGEPVVWADAADALTHMELIDAVYRAAGFEPRQTTEIGG